MIEDDDDELDEMDGEEIRELIEDDQPIMAPLPMTEPTVPPTAVEEHLVAGLTSALAHLDQRNWCNACRVIENTLSAVGALPTQRNIKKRK